MTTKSTTTDITASVASKTEKLDKNGAPFWEYGLLLSGQAKPIVYRQFDHKAGEPIGIGQVWQFRVSETPTPPTAQYPKGGVYRNIEGVLGKEDAPIGAKEALFGPDNSAPVVDHTRQSIEAQKVLDVAERAYFHWLEVQPADAKERQLGGIETARHITKIAEIFVAWLTGLKVTEGKKEE